MIYSNWVVILLILGVVLQFQIRLFGILLLILFIFQMLINAYSFFFTIQAQDFFWKIRHLMYPLNCINNKRVFLPNGKNVIAFFTHQALALRFYRSGEFDSFFEGFEAELKTSRSLKQILSTILHQSSYWQYRFYFKEAPKTGCFRIEVV